VTAAVEALQRQKTIFSARVSDLVVDGHKRHRADPAKGVTRLSPREREVVQLVSEGKSSKDVAIILNVTLATAETHRSNILKKLRLHSIAELVLYAVRNGIIQVHVPPPSFSNSERNDVRTRALTDSVPHPMPENGRTSVAP
jgi:DNA-binding NarL/FixJ family response regulator